MQVLSSPIKANFTIQKSKFLCFGYFVKSKEEIKSIIDQMKIEFSDASHICYGYILDDKTYYYTDGGEPSGSAGKPIYGAILSSKLNYTLFVVVRYFGGIKFGPGPLRSTFKNISLQTLQKAKIKSAQITDLITIHVQYSNIKNIISAFNKSIYKKNYEKEFVIIQLFGNCDVILSDLNKLNIRPISIAKNQII